MGTVRIALTPVVFQTTVQTTRRCTRENQPETRIIQHKLDVGVPTIRGFMRQPLVTSCVGLAQGCNLLASAVFFGAYLCSDRLSCESFGSHDRIRTCTTNTLNVPPTANWATWPWKMVDPVRFELTLHSTSSCWLCQLVYGSIAQTW